MPKIFTERRYDVYMKKGRVILIRAVLQIACKAISMVGDPKTELLRKSKEIKCDVVLMGARKMGAIKR